VILSSLDAELIIEPPAQSGGNSLVFSIKDSDSERASFILMPMEAIALGEFLSFWGRNRLEKGGL
jgi:hypothetical protein